jgi:hypothetical protein
MKHPYTPEKASRIIENMLKACRDMTQLFLEGYNWIRRMKGFYAHFDLEGFIEEYQTCQNFRDCILAYQIHNTCLSCSENNPEYPYHLQQCEMYQKVVDTLNSVPKSYTQKKRIDNFCLELSKDNHEEIHKLTLITKRGTSFVFCNTEFLINLQNNIGVHLRSSEIHHLSLNIYISIVYDLRKQSTDALMVR